MKKYAIAIALIGSFFFANAQEKENLEKQNWFHANFATDSIYGTASDAAYKWAEANGLKASPVVVAILDSGVDVEHEDLASVMWVNEKEVAGNGIDDDKNGYIDDVYGWNFIGGPNGNVNDDQLEITRLVKIGMDRFETIDEFTNNTNKERYPEEYAKYKEMKIEVENELAEAKMMTGMMEMQIEQMLGEINKFSEAYGTDKAITKEGLNALSSDDESVNKMKESLLSKADTDEADDIFGKTPNELIDEMKEDIDGALNYYKGKMTMYDVNFDGRSIVEDNYDDKTERYYGNNDAEGPDALHGTHVAGIVAADYNNDLGMYGVARHAKIMSVRTVPNGDERDKDVANAIIYAVDNGAKILNMSFGKGYSPEKELVWDAIKYATEKGVLMVHAAGNDNKDIDTESNFPTNYDANGNEISNTWLTVGASTRYNDKIKASFSNFGKKQVDIFAPGLEIYATVPGDKYRYLQGTSMAAPAVSGVAALVWSYFPNLSASELRDIIIESGNVNPDLLEISKEGKIVDALKALKLAAKKSNMKKR